MLFHTCNVTYHNEGALRNLDDLDMTFTEDLTLYIYIYIHTILLIPIIVILIILIMIMLSLLSLLMILILIVVIILITGPVGGRDLPHQRQPRLRSDDKRHTHTKLSDNNTTQTIMKHMNR